jgi:hypothetical protein
MIPMFRVFPNGVVLATFSSSFPVSPAVYQR